MRHNYWPLVGVLLAEYEPAEIYRISSVRLHSGDTTVPAELYVRHSANRSRYSVTLAHDVNVMLTPDENLASEPTQLEVARPALEAAYAATPQHVLVARLGHLAQDLGNRRLAEQIEQVLAARYEFEPTAAGPLGHLVYGGSYLDRPESLPLDPVHLPLGEEEFTTTKIGGMFGALRDTAPDAWGRMVLERGRTGRSWTELDYLLEASDQRVGALRYGPRPDAPTLRGRIYTFEDLERLGEAAETLQDEAAGEAPPLLDNIAELLDPSSGLGGARPKTSVVDERGQLWVAKLRARGDRRVNAVTEGAYLGLAARCGLRVPRSRVVNVDGRPTILVERFDQAPVPEGETRRFYLSAHTLLGLDESVLDRRKWSYLELAHLLRRISDEPEGDVIELFRRMVFNALVTNLDDHPRNHAVIGTARSAALGESRQSPLGL